MLHSREQVFLVRTVNSLPAVPKPGSDAATQYGPYSHSEEHSEDGRKEMNFLQPSWKLEMLLGAGLNGTSSGSPRGEH